MCRNFSFEESDCNVMFLFFFFCNGCVRIPDEDAGEIPGASVVLSPGAKESEEDIMNYVANNAAHYKKVRVVHFVESIPKSPSGKIMRRLIKDKMIQKMKTSSSTQSQNV